MFLARFFRQDLISGEYIPTGQVALLVQRDAEDRERYARSECIRAGATAYRIEETRAGRKYKFSAIAPARQRKA